MIYVSNIGFIFSIRAKSCKPTGRNTKNRLQAYIAKYVDEPANIDDILQDVYIKAHTSLHKLESMESIGAWLYRVAHNAIMDHYRRQKPVDELPEEILEAPEPDPAEQAHQEMALCLKPLIRELPGKYSMPLQLAELDGMKQQQVADQLDLSLSGAKSRIQRGRALLRERLTDCCDIEVGKGGVVDFQPKSPNSNCNSSG